MIWAASSAVALLAVRCSRRPRRPEPAESAEQHVGERAVHGLAHDDREDQAGRTVQGSGGDQQLVVEHEAHRHGRQTGVGIQQGDDRGHVGAADGDDQQHAEGQRKQNNQREQEPCIGKITNSMPATMARDRKG